MYCFYYEDSPCDFCESGWYCHTICTSFLQESQWLFLVQRLHDLQLLQAHTPIHPEQHFLPAKQPPLPADWPLHPLHKCVLSGNSSHTSSYKSILLAFNHQSRTTEWQTNCIDGKTIRHDNKFQRIKWHLWILSSQGVKRLLLRLHERGFPMSPCL